MTKTKYYDLQMDDPQDDYDVDVVNANLKKIDEQMKTRENATDALQEPEFTVAAKRENIASKEKMPKILGKIAKFFADLKAVAFTGNYNDLSGKPTSLLANGGNSDTVNSHTVESNVPKNAKFTDTTYSNFVKSGTGAKAGLVPAPSTTAGTTKYLREDGAWKTPPDTKTSIVNNNTTTEPGSALDARQANPNIEGTMAANIQQINSNLNTVFYAIKETKDANNADPGIARMPPNSNLTFENSPMVSKKYNLAKNGSITIPCLNCIIFFVGHLASHFLIATTVGYQSDSIRSRVSFVNGNEQIGVTIAYSKEDTLEAYSGKFTISNTRDSMDVIVIGIKNYSKV